VWSDTWLRSHTAIISGSEAMRSVLRAACWIRSSSTATRAAASRTAGGAPGSAGGAAAGIRSVSAMGSSITLLTLCPTPRRDQIRLRLGLRNIDFGTGFCDSDGRGAAARVARVAEILHKRSFAGQRNPHWPMLPSHSQGGIGETVRRHDLVAVPYRLEGSIHRKMPADPGLSEPLVQALWNEVFDTRIRMLLDEKEGRGC